MEDDDQTVQSSAAVLLDAMFIPSRKRAKSVNTTGARLPAAGTRLPASRPAFEN
jgi:hypothetical protein